MNRPRGKTTSASNAGSFKTYAHGVAEVDLAPDLAGDQPAPSPAREWTLEDLAAESDAPPPGEGWRKVRHEACTSWVRDFPVEGAMASHSVDTYDAPRRRFDSESTTLGGGGITIDNGHVVPGELHYQVVIAPMLDERGQPTGEQVKAVKINWVQVKAGRGGGRGKGWASAMYAAIRAAHPDAIIPAAECLEPLGKRLVKHYRDKHPRIHTGRFDTRGRIHPTSGSSDPLYRRDLLEAD